MSVKTLSVSTILDTFLYCILSCVTLVAGNIFLLATGTLIGSTVDFIVALYPRYNNTNIKNINE